MKQKVSLRETEREKVRKRKIEQVDPATRASKVQGCRHARVRSSFLNGDIHGLLRRIGKGRVSHVR